MKLPKIQNNGFTLIELMVAVTIVSLLAIASTQLFISSQKQYVGSPSQSSASGVPAKTPENFQKSAKKVMAAVGGQTALVNFLSSLDASYRYLHLPVAIDMSLPQQGDVIRLNQPAMRSLVELETGGGSAAAPKFMFRSMTSEEWGKLGEITGGLDLTPNSTEFFRDEDARVRIILEQNRFGLDLNQRPYWLTARQSTVPKIAAPEAGLNGIYATWPIPILNKNADNSEVRVAQPFIALRNDGSTLYSFDPNFGGCGNNLAANKFVFVSSRVGAEPPKVGQLMALRSEGNDQFRFFQEVATVKEASNCPAGIQGFELTFRKLSLQAWKEIIPNQSNSTEESKKVWASDDRALSLEWPVVKEDVWKHVWFPMGASTLIFQKNPNGAHPRPPRTCYPEGPLVNIQVGNQLTKEYAYSDTFKKFACSLRHVAKQTLNAKVEKVIGEVVQLSALWIRHTPEARKYDLMKTDYFRSKFSETPGKFTTIPSTPMIENLSGAVVMARKVGSTQIQMFLFDNDEWENVIELPPQPQASVLAQPTLPPSSGPRTVPSVLGGRGGIGSGVAPPRGGTTGIPTQGGLIKPPSVPPKGIEPPKPQTPALPPPHLPHDPRNPGVPPVPGGGVPR